MDFLKRINWKVRLSNRAWCLTMIAALFVLATAIAKLFGYEIDLNNLQANVVDVVYAIFGVLAVLGVVIDGTTPGIEDSERAMSYEIPGGAIGKADEIENKE